MFVRSSGRNQILGREISDQWEPYFDIYSDAVI